MPQPLRPRSLYLWGESRLGKTQWARSLGPHIYFNTLVDWKDPETYWRIKTGNYNYIIFDDFDPKEWFKRYYKQFFGAQEKVTVTDKYMSKVSFKHHKPCIFLSNLTPQWIGWEYDTQWISHNVVEVMLESALF